jgi:hypothetical protein
MAAICEDFPVVAPTRGSVTARQRSTYDPRLFSALTTADPKDTSIAVTLVGLAKYSEPTKFFASQI